MGTPKKEVSNPLSDETTNRPDFKSLHWFPRLGFASAFNKVVGLEILPNPRVQIWYITRKSTSKHRTRDNLKDNVAEIGTAIPEQDKIKPTDVVLSGIKKLMQ